MYSYELNLNLPNKVINFPPEAQLSNLDFALLAKKKASLYNSYFAFLSLVFLLISNLTNGLHLHQFLETKTTEANKSLKLLHYCPTNEQKD